MTNYRIPFNKPAVVGNEFVYMARAVANGHMSGDGEFTALSHELLERELSAARVLLTTSCTHALEMAALLLEIQPSDEVIVPSYTFVSTVNAFMLRGATPIFADIRPDTLNLDERQLESLITPRTRAVVPVHYGGVGCHMEPILALAARKGFAVVEDNAHGLFGKYRGKPLGTFGCLAAQSFHETKNISCGEGGALVINDRQFFDRAEIVREKGTNRSRFFRGEVDKYTWVDVGSSFLPSDGLAAFLCAQLERSELIQATRRRIWHYYDQHLRSWANEHGVRLPFIPGDCEQSYHMFYLILPSLAARQALIMHLKQQGILAAFHYSPLHTSPMGRHYGGHVGQCPVTERTSECLLRLPFYFDLTESLQAEVVECIREFVVSAENQLHCEAPVCA